MLYVGLGTGLGATVIFNGIIEPLELGRFRYKKSTLEKYVGKRGLERLGRKKWQGHVEFILERMIAALKPDDVVLGGGNAKKLKGLPPGTRLGDNANAFVGGMRCGRTASIGRAPLPGTQKKHPNGLRLSARGVRPGAPSRRR